MEDTKLLENGHLPDGSEGTETYTEEYKLDKLAGEEKDKGDSSLDGGWGWVVLAAVVVVQFLVAGWTRSVNACYKEIKS